jgi:ROS/MUCR transcriptional regulator protein
MPPSEEAVRRAVEALMCPWCGKGPFKLLARHTNAAHGIDRNELRDRAGLCYNASVSSPDLSAQRSAHARKLQEEGKLLSGPSGTRNARRKLSKAAQALNLQKLDAARDPDQARSALEKARPAANAAARKAAQERGEATPHGTYRKYHSYGCRCDACTTANTEYYRMYRASRTTHGS